MAIAQTRKRGKPYRLSGNVKKHAANTRRTRNVHKTRRSNKKQTKHTDEVPKSPVVIGLIYANWCHHCQAMKPAWDEMKNDIMNKYAGQFSIVEIEAGQPDKSEQLAKLEQMLDGQKIDASGYPTIVKLAGGRADYYGGNRELADMKRWAIGQDNAPIIGGFQKVKQINKRSRSRSRSRKHTPISK